MEGRIYLDIDKEGLTDINKYVLQRKALFTKRWYNLRVFYSYKSALKEVTELKERTSSSSVQIASKYRILKIACNISIV